MLISMLVNPIMATILPELATELEAKRDRIIKDITNVDRSSVIPNHTNNCLLYTSDAADE